MKAFRYISAITALLLGAGTISAQDVGHETTGAATGPTKLSPTRIEVIYIAYGRATTIQLTGVKSTPRFFLGAPIVAYQYEKDTKQVQLTAAVEEGETNLNVTVDGITYVWVLKIVQDTRLNYLRTFTIVDETAEEDAKDEAALSRARPLKPFEVDIVQATQTAERAKRDGQFRKTLPNYRYLTLAKPYSWNDNIVNLVEVHQFLDSDLLLFKVEWVNRAGEAIYLNVRQYGLAVANQKIPVIAAMQDSPNSIVMPGQHEVVWLAVQGYRLRRHNEWQLVLPPDGAAVKRLR